MSSKRILVTGAAGFVGANLLARLRTSGFRAVGIDSFSDYYSTNMKVSRVAELGLKDLVSNLDITDSKSLEAFISNFRPTHIVHLAAQGGVRASRTNPEPYISSNQLGFLNVLRASENHEVQKLIYASSSSVYGDQESGPFAENTKLKSPKSLYALSKMSNEIIAQTYPTLDLQILGLRFFTVYGPWGRPDMLIFRVLAASLLGKKHDLTASLSVQRDFTYIDDVTMVIEEALKFQSEDKLPPILNISGGNPKSISDFFEICEDLGIGIESHLLPSDAYDVTLTHGSTDLLKTLGFTIPQTSFSLGVKSTYNWLSQIPIKEIETWYDFNT